VSVVAEGKGVQLKVSHRGYYDCEKKFPGARQIDNERLMTLIGEIYER